MIETKDSFCRICESLCGLKIKIENDRIITIEPNRDHLVTKGFSCIKGRYQHEIYQSPDRLEYPLKKMSDGSYSRISWEDALSEIGEKLKKIRKVNGPDSIGMYVGTAAGFSVLHPVFAQGFMTAMGSKSMYASATQDCSSKFAVSQHMYGFPFTQPHPDLDNINCLIIVGANPIISKWSFLQINNPSLQLQKIEKRNAKIYVVDPRETETAKSAGQHIFIRPGSDVFFYLSFLNELIKQDGIKRDNIGKFMKSFEDVKNLADEWPASKTEKLTSIKEEVLKEMVSDYINADGAALYCSTGVNMGGNGTISYWIQEVINAVSGNLDRRGGTIVGKGIIDFIKFGAKNGILLRDDRSRIGDFPSVNDAFPGGILADEILSKGDKQLKAMFVTGGNPLITMANSQRLKKAFNELELLVSIDIQQNETSSIADYVLPSTDPFQRPDLPFIFPLMLGLQMKPYLQATKAIVNPKGEQRDEASIYLDLCKAAGVNLFNSNLAQIFFELIQKYYTKKNKKQFSTLPQESILNGLLRITRQKSFNTILKKPNGYLRKQTVIGGFLGKRVVTKDKLIDLAPRILIEDAKKLNKEFHEQIIDVDKFKLITKRDVNTHNSWTHNTERMISKGKHTNYAFMHPDDMNELNLKENELIDISSKTATIRIAVKQLNTLMRKCVAVPHGWGHQNAIGMNIAKKTHGVNVNILAADGPENVDKVSGMSKLTAINVEINASKANLENNWSGL